MPFSALEKYLASLSGDRKDTRIRPDAQGRAQGRYFNATLTSAFQPIRRLDDGAIIGSEGFVRSYSAGDHGLSPFKLLDQAANDDESVELDRLCRMLHAINFFRQPQAADSSLYLNVHARLLTAVGSNHGIAFGRILKLLELPQESVVLQLPEVTERQGWLLNYVADNYRRNGFRLAVNASGAVEALGLLDRVRPELVKLDGRYVPDDASTIRLLEECGRLKVGVVFKRVESPRVLEALRRLGERTGQTIHAQGFLWDMPAASVIRSSGKRTDFVDQLR
jgi:EAL domain-containing protein (putative c-di-GMP-specific phosphodiesterase class I)